jgi:hypothetical protein
MVVAPLACPAVYCASDRAVPDKSNRGAGVHILGSGAASLAKDAPCVEGVPILALAGLSQAIGHDLEGISQGCDLSVTAGVIDYIEGQSKNLPSR